MIKGVGGVGRERLYRLVGSREILWARLILYDSHAH